MCKCVYMCVLCVRVYGFIFPTITTDWALEQRHPNSNEYI